MELLVVIAIIALLMSILVPALARVRRQAKDVLCQSNLRQWSVCFSMYTDDYEGYFNAGWPSGYSDGALAEWHNSLLPYIGDDTGLACCPEATKPESEGGLMPLAAWGEYAGPWFRVIRYGSYGINGYVHDPPPGWESHGRPREFFWRHKNVKGTTEIPLFMDAQRFDGWPLQEDIPPEFESDYFGGTWSDQMRRFCVNRHIGAVNGICLDLAVRRIPLKCLWKLKWHRMYDTNGDQPTWETEALWMRNFKECE